MLDDNTWNKLQVNRMFVTQGEFIGCGGGGGVDIENAAYST